MERDRLAYSHAKEVSIPDLSWPCWSFKDDIGSVPMYLVEHSKQKGEWREGIEQWASHMMKNASPSESCPSPVLEKN